MISSKCRRLIRTQSGLNERDDSTPLAGHSIKRYGISSGVTPHTPTDQHQRLVTLPSFDTRTCVTESVVRSFGGEPRPALDLRVSVSGRSNSSSRGNPMGDHALAILPRPPLHLVTMYDPIIRYDDA